MTPGGTLEFCQLIRQMFKDPDPRGPVWQYFLDHARGFTLIDEARSQSMKRTHELGPRQCYWNCQLMVQMPWNRGTLEYWEGYAVGVIPVQHAWLIDPQQPEIVIDPTWVGNNVPNSLDYLGIHIPTPWIAKRVEETELAESIAFYYAYEQVERAVELQKRRD